jgi:hypothetical protein
MSDANLGPSEISNIDDDDDDDNALYLETYRPPFLPLLVLAFPVMPLFWSYTVRVTKDRLRFGYSYRIVAKTVDRSSVGEAIPIDHVNGLTQWGGWGIRLRPASGQSSSDDEQEEKKNKSWWESGYIAKNGGAVKVTLNDEKASIYYFSCDNPQTVCDILNAK